MKTITALAISRMRYYKSRTIVTIIAIILTTCLLMTIGTAGIGTININRELLLKNGGNQHATVMHVSKEQIKKLENHMSVEALSYQEAFAVVVKDKINASLSYTETVMGNIKNLELTEGHYPEKENEIAAPPIFFEKLGYTQPKIGDTIKIDYRIYGKGIIQTKDFVITGLLTQMDISKLNISDTRIAYSAFISRALIDSFIPEQERYFSASIRVKGEEHFNFDEIQQKILQVTTDIGIKENDVSMNMEYLALMTNPGTEILTVIVFATILVTLFSGLVIYSIYYISVITNIQELGKLKALGATKKQIKKLLLKEGSILTLFSLPIGILLSYIISYAGLKFIINDVKNSFYVGTTSEIELHIFSFPVLFCVILVVFATMYLSLLKPMKTAGKISPIEAIRYQEKAMQKQVCRKGYTTITLSRLCYANLSRNKKRTIITIGTMGLSCIMFMAVAGLMNSIDVDDFARMSLPKGEFCLQLHFSTNDMVYKENNLEMLQQKDLLGEEQISKIMNIPGVTKVEKNYIILGETQHSSFSENNRIEIGTFTRDDLEDFKKELKRGDLEYDRIVEENGILYNWDNVFEQRGLAIGETIPFSFYDGSKKVPFKGTLMASLSRGNETFMIAEETMNQYIKEINMTAKLYIYAEADFYDSIKSELKKIEAENIYFRLISYDEEKAIAISALRMMKYPIYLLLLFIGMIGFMNLINTMITSIVTRKKELGILQAIGLSNKQLVKMLQKEGILFTIGTLTCALTFGNLLGYLIFVWGKNTGFMSVTTYHYPFIETIIMISMLVGGQFLITFFANKNIHKQSLIERMRQQE